MASVEHSLRYQAYGYIAAGISSLMLVHAIGRFAFTPLLPYFIQDHLISINQGADLATSNYLGYLIGALIAVYLNRPDRLKRYVCFGLVINAALTIMQCLSAAYIPLLLLRLANGMSNGLVFVLAPALILEWLSEHQLSRLSGLVYFGVGLGLIVSGILVDWTAPFFTGQWRWLPIAIACIPLLVFSLYQISKIQIHPQVKTAQASQKLFDVNSTPLFISYIGAGLGYILPMTFLPALAHQVGGEHTVLVKNVWLITSLSCSLFIPIWNSLGTRWGDRQALLGSYWIQALGVLLILLMPNIWGVLGCAVFVGAGFLGSVMCTQRLARFFQPHQGPKLSAAMITIYAGAQLFGPWLAKLWIEHGGSLQQSFAVGLLAFIWGLFWTWRTPNKIAI
ncbi:YbfB/YjiJ family MFS transporter [Acinetobacter sp. ANC 4641]|uniref:YbfB/YjiJ family MFS transporter n=1 Tax=Acinetobacter sp. ANC 4641 TaxID=2529847 RepID=UPI00103C0225|nr:YbfB/YjiJ family MFS transporter [Acinetobacter sp. ANC 4641]TCB10780.1 YbfB/YjiJ family MFS transporter [Acinetobacter sp. ANC 4641]